MLAGVLALGVLAATGQASRLEAAATADFAYTGYHNSSSGPAAPPASLTQLYDNGFAGDAGARLTIFAARRVVDDDTPLSLQPFLQRLTTVTVSAGGAGIARTSTDAQVQAGNPRQERHALGYGAAAVDAYVHPNLVVFGSFAARWDSRATDPLPGTTSLDLPIAAGLGIRAQDLRIDVGYSVVVTDAAHQAHVPYWGGVSLRGRVVLERRTLLDLSIDLADGGAQVRLAAGFYLQRDVGVLAALSGGSSDAPVSATVGGPIIDARERWNLGAAIGISWWATRRFAVVAWFQHTHEQMVNLYDEVETVSLALRVRP